MNHKIKLNYFPNDQTKYIDYVIYYKDGPDADKDSELKRIRDKFIKQLIEKEDFDVQKNFFKIKINHQIKTQFIYIT